MRAAELPNYVNIVFDQYYFKYNPHIPVHYTMLCYMFVTHFLLLLERGTVHL